MKTVVGTFDSDRGRLYCRACSSNDIYPVLNLGNLPIANELPIGSDEVVELFPLCFSICMNCGLGQVGEPISRERLFSDYRYLSSISETWLSHAKDFANEITKSFNLTSEDMVIEIASNDGYLLQYFKQLKVQVLGIEPAKNIAKSANSKGIKTLNEFFGYDTAKNLRQRLAPPRLIIANNVAAHVPDLRDFFSGLDMLAGSETLISIENPSILNLIRENQFDTIYHEHYSYLSAFTIKKISKEFKLNLFKVEPIATHGGSNRYWLKREEPNDSERLAVDAFIESELNAGLLSIPVWSKFSNGVQATLFNLAEWLRNCSLEGRRVFGFTAAAKASTILNAGKISQNEVAGIADSSPEKQGRLLPSLGIPIISSEELCKNNPTDILIFAWNISEEISKIIWDKLGLNVRCWVAIPDLKELNNGK